MKQLLLTMLLTISFSAFSLDSNSWVILDGAAQYDFNNSKTRCYIMKSTYRANESIVSMSFITNDFVFDTTFRGIALQNGENNIHPIRIENLKLTEFEGGPSVRSVNSNCKILLSLDIEKKEMSAKFTCSGLSHSQSPFKSTLEGMLSCSYSKL